MDESNCLKYFSKGMHNTAELNNFSEFLKLTNYIGRLDAKYLAKILQNVRLILIIVKFFWT